MSAIREELILADRFSDTFTRYLNLMRQSTRAGTEAAASQRQLDAASGKTGDALVRMAGAALDAAQAMGGVYDETSRVVTSCERVNRKMREGSRAASGLESRLLALAKTYAGLRTAQAFIGMADTFTQTTARLDRMNDGMQSTAELQNMIYQAAQRSRGGYQDMADMVGKLGTMAGDAFGSNTELVAFAEQINKQFALAGTSGQGMQAAMLQLTQAMSSGVLRGEELNSILEQAPTIAQTIAKYMGANVGEMREMASQGKITADVVKTAMFAAAKETNAAFENIPLTFGQAWTMAGNAAAKAMQPAMQRLTDLLNSDLGQRAVNGLITGFELLGSAATGVIDLLAMGAQWVADNWDFVSMVLQFAGGAVLAFTALSVASSLKRAAGWAIEHWQITLVVLLIGAVVTAMYAMGMSSEEVFGKIGAGAGALYVFGHNLVASGWNLIASFTEFFALAFSRKIEAVAVLFQGLFNFIMDIVSTAAGAIDALLGTHMADAVRGFQNKMNAWVGDIAAENGVKVKRMELLDVHSTMAQWGQAGAGMGRALDSFSVNDILGGFSGTATNYAAMLDSSGIPGSLNAIKGDTAAIKRSVSLSEEDMKLLVDMAERKYVNNINLTAQTPVITINGQNTGDTEEDLRWLENALTRILVEQAASHTDLSYQ